MSRSAPTHSDPQAIAGILDEYSRWFARLLRQVLYPEESDSEIMEPPALQRAGGPKALGAAYDRLARYAGRIAGKTMQSGQPIECPEFDELLEFYETLTDILRELQKNASAFAAGSGDALGLRDISHLEPDLAREMSRLERQGKPFCLALVRIDNLGQIRKQHGAEAADECVRTVAGLIHKSVRSFDDAYRLDEDRFVLSLKQADMVGGVQALERLKRELERHRAQYKIDGQKTPLTLSSCIAEPAPGDDLNELLNNLKNDLESLGRAEGAVLEFIEMSPLQRYAKDVHD